MGYNDCMNRGMITLSKTELVFLDELLHTHPDQLLSSSAQSEPGTASIPSELPIRIAAGLTTTTDPVQLELSEESAEALLDLLPPPSFNQAPSTPSSIDHATDHSASVHPTLTTTLRQTVQTFLGSLRSPHSPP